MLRPRPLHDAALALAVLAVPLAGCQALAPRPDPAPAANAAANAPARSPAPPAPAEAVAAATTAEVAADKADAEVRPVEAQGEIPRPLTANLPPRNTATVAVAVPSPEVIPTSPKGVYPLDLSTALRLADAENPTIAAARASILEALAIQTSARALLVPSLNAGSNYHGHTGNLQRSSGRILNLSEQSLYFGGGARTLAAESLSIPAINIASPLTDAIFEPLAAHQRVIGSRFVAGATANEVLGQVADLYLELLGAEAILEAQRLSESQVAELVRITAAFAKIGERSQADADRGAAEWKLFRARVQMAEEGVAVAAARLSQRLNLDPSVRLKPLAGQLAPISLVDLAVPAEDLVQAAVRRRPELGARLAQVNAARYRIRQETSRPLLPTVWIGFSGGGFGGGSNIVPPFLGNFGGRTDFDVRVYWTLQNFGVGNLALIKGRQAERNAALAEQARTINRVRQEVVSARADALAQLGQIAITNRERATAEQGLQDDLERTRNGAGRPLEVVDSLRLVAAARVNQIRALVLYDQAQFRLFVALGSPPPPGPLPSTPPPPPPITTPLHSPINARIPLLPLDVCTPPLLPPGYGPR
jgi:outer membrane protein TolC